MGKRSHEVTESVIMRLCEWCLLNCYNNFSGIQHEKGHPSSPMGDPDLIVFYLLILLSCLQLP